jgi:hypothetical protein
MKKLVLTLSFLVVNLGVLTSQAFANPIGTLNLANCAGQGVTVTDTTVLFGGNCIQTGLATSVTTSFGVLGPSVTGSISNLPVTPATNPFMVFPVGVNSLNFFLTGIGPGVFNTSCSTTLDPNAASCSVFPGSPFVLVPGSGGTTVRLDAHGLVSDGAGSSNWNGSFSANFAGLTPSQVQTTFINNHTLASTTYAGSFLVTIIPAPEPMTLSMLGLGLLGIGLVSHRKGRK